jgi:N-acetylmuramoyl-L-alanine amidase
VVECEFATQPDGLAGLRDAGKRDELAKRLANGIANWALGSGEASHAP